MSNRYTALSLLLADVYREAPVDEYFSFWTAAQQIQGLQPGQLMDFIYAYNSLYPRARYGMMDSNSLKVARLEAMALLAPTDFPDSKDKE